MKPVKPEVLSPAGSPEALQAAIGAGADAVYFGLGDFNARIRARNFELGDLPEIVKDLRRWGVRSYLTFNTLVFLEEWASARATLEAVAAAGPDALIVQDLGVARWIRKHAPGLPLHGSTQMTLASGPALRLAEELGLRRVILARELTLAEIARLRRETGLELEVFVHGALCISYSGQCLSSEAFGGRSANRGQCAQACRLPYDLVVDGRRRDLGDRAYLLSPKDLEGVGRLKELIRLGISGLKIEGRMKSPEYVAAATALYRKAVDRAWQEVSGEASEEDVAAADGGHAGAEEAALLRDVRQVFSRGGGEGFLGGIDHQKLVDGRTRSHRGLFLGTVVEVERGHDRLPRAIIFRTEDAAASAQLHPGDGLLLAGSALEEDEIGGRLMSVDPVPPAGCFRIAFPRASMPDLRRVQPGHKVYRSADPRLLERLRGQIRHPEHHRQVPLAAEVEGSAGEPLVLRLTDPEGRSVEARSALPLQPAAQHAVDLSQVREQMGRMGGTRYRLESITLSLAPELFLPFSELNRIRREAVDALDRRRGEAPTEPAPPPERAEGPEAPAAPSPVLWAVEQAEAKRSGTPEASGTVSSPGAAPGEAPDLPGSFAAQALVLCRNAGQVEGALEAGARRIILDFLDLRGLKEAAAGLRASGLPAVLALPRVQKPGEERITTFFLGLEPEGILVRNLGSLEDLRDHRRRLEASASRFPGLIGDVSLNAVNPEAVAALLELGCDRVAPGFDLNGAQLKSLVRTCDPRRFEIPLHHHLPIFHLEHCVFAALLSDGADFRTCGRPCDRHRIELKDRVGQAHPVVADVGCRNTIFAARPQSALGEWEALRAQGVAHFRIELQSHNKDEAAAVIQVYRRAWEGRLSPRAAIAELRAEAHFGISTGSPEPPRKLETKPAGGARPAPRSKPGDRPQEKRDPGQGKKQSRRPHAKRSRTQGEKRSTV